MSKWQQWEEQQVSGTDESTPSISRCHQVLQKDLWSSQVLPSHYQFDFDTSQCTGSFVGWGDYDYDYESDRFQMEREFSRCHRAQPCITNHPFWRLNHRLENYNLARPWIMPEPRRNCRSPHRAHSYTPTATRPSSRRSRSVSFPRDNSPNRSNNVRTSRSPVQPVNVNIMTPACVLPSVHHVRTTTPLRPAAPPPYLPPSPIYCPDPTPSPASTNIVNSPAHCSGGSVILNPECPRPGTPVFKRQSVLTLRKIPNVHDNDRNKQKLWQKI